MKPYIALTFNFYLSVFNLNCHSAVKVAAPKTPGKGGKCSDVLIELPSLLVEVDRPSRQNKMLAVNVAADDELIFICVTGHVPY